MRDKFAKDFEHYCPSTHTKSSRHGHCEVQPLSPSRLFFWLPLGAEAARLERLDDSTEGDALQATWEVSVRREHKVGVCGDDSIFRPALPLDCAYDIPTKIGDTSDCATRASSGTESAPAAAPKGGVPPCAAVSAEPGHSEAAELEEVFLVHDAQLQSGARGIQYRRSPSMGDRSSYMAPFRSVVVGVLHEGGWVKVEDAEFLPVSIWGRQVLTRLAVDELLQRSSAPGLDRFIGEAFLVKGMEGLRRRVDVIGANADGTLNVLDKSENIVRTDLFIDDLMKEPSSICSETSI